MKIWKKQHNKKNHVELVSFGSRIDLFFQLNTPVNEHTLWARKLFIFVTSNLFITAVLQKLSGRSEKVVGRTWFSFSVSFACRIDIRKTNFCPSNLREVQTRFPRWFLIVFIHESSYRRFQFFFWWGRILSSFSTSELVEIKFSETHSWGRVWINYRIRKNTEENRWKTNQNIYNDFFFERVRFHSRWNFPQ